MNNPEEFFEENNELIKGIIYSIGKRHHLNQDQLDDFSGEVNLALCENDFKRIKVFRGDCSKKTYLTLVITRILFDWERREKGRWRPSEKARRMGPEAVEAEELLRDGCSEEEVFIKLQQKYTIDEKEFQNMLLKIKRKTQRTTIGLDEPGINIAAQDPHPDTIIDEKRLHEKRKKVNKFLEKMINDLRCAEDRLMIKMKFFNSGHKNTTIAQYLKKDRKDIERRIKRILSDFKEKILRFGININDLLDLDDEEG